MWSLHFYSLVHHFGIFGGVTTLNLNQITTNLEMKRYELGIMVKWMHALEMDVLKCSCQFYLM